MSAEGGTPALDSDETHLNTSPAWTADGDVLFISNLGGARDIYMQRLNRDLTPRGESGSYHDGAQSSHDLDQQRRESAGV